MSRTDPCPTPWCDHSDAPYVWQGPDDQFTVICGGCQVEGPHEASEAEAFAAWNTRLNTTRSPVLSDEQVEVALTIFNGGLVVKPDPRARGRSTAYYKPREAMRAAIEALSRSGMEG